MTTRTSSFSQVDAWMRVSKRIDIASVCLLIAFAVVAVIGIADMWPPRVLDDTQAHRVQ